MGFERDFREEGISGRWNRWGDLHFGMIQDISFLEKLFERGKENGKRFGMEGTRRKHVPLVPPSAPQDRGASFPPLRGLLNVRDLY